VGGTPERVEHPRVIYPTAQILQFPPVAAAGGGLDEIYKINMAKRSISPLLQM